MEYLIIRRAATAALAGAMTLSLASCMLLGTNKKEIVEAADEFASTLLKQDAGKIIKLTNEKKNSEAAESLEAMFDSSLYSDEQNEFINAVSDTITYEVDEESVAIDKEAASVDVVFTMVDYEKALGDDLSDIDEVLDAIDDCDDTKDIEVTFEFEKDDDTWLLTNIDDKGFGKLFDYFFYELDLMPDLFELLDTTSTLPGTYYVDYYLYFTEDVSAYEDLMTYAVYYNGELIESDLAPVVYGTYIWCTYSNPDYSDLESGEYYFSFECGDTVTTSDTVTIEKFDPLNDGSSYDPLIEYNPDVVGSGELGDMVVAVDWWNDNGNYTYTDTYGIEYDVYFTSDITYTQMSGITYSFYDEDFNVLADHEDVIRGNKTTGPSDDGFFYIYVCYPETDDFDSYLEPGTYYVEVFNPDGTTLLYDNCTVN